MTVERPNVLLVDDEEVFRVSTAALLQRDGFHCDMAQDSEEASELLSNSYDVLISDIRMPGNTQLEFLREVRHQHPELPILVVTGYPSLDTALTSLRLSCVDYLLKPVEWPEMLNAISQAVRLGQCLRALRKGLDETTHLSTSLACLERAITLPGRATSRKSLAWPLQNYLAQSAAQMNILSANIRETLASIQTETSPAASDVCKFMDCPRQTAYKQALVHTIEVLERTKHSFKSKELGELRRQLETLLEESID
jgi:DNA-binding response OmpR family regulator